MMLCVLLSKGANEEVRVVIPFDNVQIDLALVVTAFGRFDQVFWLQKLILPIEIVSCALVNQNVRLIFVSVVLDQINGVIFHPVVSVAAQMSTEVFLSPSTVQWVQNWRKCTDTGIFSWIFEEPRNGTIAAHGMAGDRNLSEI